MDLLAGAIIAAAFFYVATDDVIRPHVVAQQDYYDVKGVSLQNLPVPPDSRERRTPVGEVASKAPDGAYLKGSPLPDVLVTADQRNIRLDNFE